MMSAHTGNQNSETVLFDTSNEANAESKIWQGHRNPQTCLVRMQTGFKHSGAQSSLM